MKYVYFLFLLLFIVTPGCKDKDNKLDGIPQAIPPLDPDGWLIINPKVSEDDPDIKDIRSHAKSLIEKRSTEEDVYSIIVADYFHYEFVFNGNKMSDVGQFNGYWIDYKDDFTYEYGNYDEVVGSGQYHYSLNSGKMIMVDDNPARKPQEWTIMAKDDVIIQVGSDYFGNNPRQIKIVRSPVLPLKVS